jgi:outer membrane protein assembly factor BamB
VASTDTELKLTGGSGLKVPAGRHEFKLEQPEVWRQEIQRALGLAVPPAASTASAPAAPQVSAPAPKEIWQFRPSSVTEISDLAAADIDGDGRIETLVCAGTELVCLDSVFAPSAGRTAGLKADRLAGLWRKNIDQGQERWRFACKRPLLCVCAADVNGDKKLEVLCGGQDQAFHVLDAGGKLLAEHVMTEKLVVGQGGTSVPNVKCIAVGDLDGDGKKEIVVGTSNSNISAFRWPGLERIWTRSGVYHGAGRIALADLDGSVGAHGRAPLHVLVSDHYGSVHVITSDGRLEANAYSELGDVIFDVGDLDGDGKLDVLNGSSTGVLTASAYPIKPLWAFNNYGYPVRAVLACDLDGDGKAEVIAGLDSGYLFALGGDGKVRWQLETGSAVLSLASASAGGDLIAGLRDGSLLVVSPKGEVLMRAPQPSAITKILPLPGQAHRVLVLDETNTVRQLEW